MERVSPTPSMYIPSLTLLSRRCVNDMIRRDHAIFGGPDNLGDDARPEPAGPVVAQGASLVDSIASGSRP